ncbi:MAG: hypothetical protein COA69_00815 [Robiginitomaculum sp.]|nr:MAG: hypothetical protein COA69_00815 [Robiginitomaculum sp.]
MTDRFKYRASGSTGSASNGFPIVPNDATELAETVRAIYIGGTGTITLVLSGGAELTFTNVPAGIILPVRAISVKSTGTDATNLVGLV